MDSLVPSIRSPAKPSRGLLVRFAKKTHRFVFCPCVLPRLGSRVASGAFLLGTNSRSTCRTGGSSLHFHAPSIAGLCMQWLTEGNLRVCRFYDSGRSFLLGIIIGPALILISFVVLPVMLAEKAPLQTLNWHAFVSLTSYHLQHSVFPHNRRGTRLAGLRPSTHAGQT